MSMSAEAPVAVGEKQGGSSPAPLIEDHALIGDLHTAALVAKDGSIDFLCLPDFDSDAAFASLLGTPANGRWRIAPSEPIRAVRRRYRGRTLILETELVTDGGTIRLIDFMPLRTSHPHLVRWVEGVQGKVPIRFELQPRFASGYTIPRVSARDGATAALAGPDGLYLRGGKAKEPPPFEAEFTVSEGDSIPFVLTWAPPYEPIPESIDAKVALRQTEVFWEQWASRIDAPAPYQDVIIRSLLTLKACCFETTGAIVAAPTFGLPETPGGERNWDYRFCWIRDASLTLNAFIRAGLTEEAKQFGAWLVNAVGGAAGQLQIMYGIRGERQLTEITLPWLQGYGGARPVRIGNGAYDQFQLDVFGEFAAVLYSAIELIGVLTPEAEAAFRAVANRTAEAWMKQDHGIWEMRGPKRDFTASKVAAWTVIDRWIRLIEKRDLNEDFGPWKQLRQQIFDEVCAKGFNAERNTFTQYYGGTTVDASLLAIPMLGFLPPSDPRVAGTVKAIEEDLMPDGLVLRYRTDQSDDGLSGEEGVFLACSFWLAGTYHLMGRTEDARRLFEKVAGLCNDVGLLAEEYLPRQRQQIGNFPQAFSHLALVNCAYALSAT
jgi:GH15 family glucan-1,4-alpha-glucosidase